MHASFSELNFFSNTHSRPQQSDTIPLRNAQAIVEASSTIFGASLLIQLLQSTKIDGAALSQLDETATTEAALNAAKAFVAELERRAAGANANGERAGFAAGNALSKAAGARPKATHQYTNAEIEKFKAGRRAERAKKREERRAEEAAQQEEEDKKRAELEANIMTQATQRAEGEDKRKKQNDEERRMLRKESTMPRKRLNGSRRAWERLGILLR